MKLTRRGHYSVKAMLDLVVWGKKQPTSVREIAERQSIPSAYLEKLLIELRHAGLVESLRGSQGGYRLKRSPKEISIGEILAAVGEDVHPLPRLSPNSAQAQDWVAFSLWKRLDGKFRDALYSIYLEDLYYDACSRKAAETEEMTFTI